MLSTHHAGTRLMGLAVIMGVIGMALGTVMGAIHDFRLMPVHAHINVIGWVGFFLMGMFYRSMEDRAGRLPFWHFWLSLVGLVLMSAGLVPLLLGVSAAEPIVGLGSVVTLVAFVLFAVVVLAELRSRAA